MSPIPRCASWSFAGQWNDSAVSSFPGRWPGIGVYTATKAALNTVIDTWRAEHPGLGFARVDVGPTAGGSTKAEADASAFPHQARWLDLGLTSGALAEAESTARAVSSILTDRARVWEITVQPREGALPWGQR